MKKLVESAYASGRFVHVTTYHDGNTPIKAQLLFRTPEEAVQFVALITGAPTDR